MPKPKLTDAQLISGIYDDNGQFFEPSRTITVRLSDGSRVKARADDGDIDPDRIDEVLDGCARRFVSPDASSNAVRFELPDRSAIVIDGAAWDIESTEDGALFEFAG